MRTIFSGCWKKSRGQVVRRRLFSRMIKLWDNFIPSVFSIEIHILEHRARVRIWVCRVVLPAAIQQFSVRKPAIPLAAKSIHLQFYQIIGRYSDRATIMPSKVAVRSTRGRCECSCAWSCLSPRCQCLRSAQGWLASLFANRNAITLWKRHITPFGVQTPILSLGGCEKRY